MNNKLFDMVFNLKFQAKQLNRQAAKCEKDEKVEKDKAFKAMKKNNMDGAQIHASNAIRLHNENLQFLRIASQYVSPGFVKVACWRSCCRSCLDIQYSLWSRLRYHMYTTMLHALSKQ
jgi:hypothetical protein